MTQKIKRALSMLLTAVLCFTTFSGLATTAYAAGEQGTAYLISFPRDGDEAYSGEWGHDAQTYINGWKTDKSRYTTVYAMNSYTGNICYCIEPGTPLETGNILGQKGEDFWEQYPSDYNKTISPETIKLMIGRIFQYGYTGTISTSWRSQNEGAENLSHAVATQLLIWETVVGERDADFNKVSTGGKNAILDQISSAHPLHDKIMSYYHRIEQSVQSHVKLPSFLSDSKDSAQTTTLTWDGSKYTATLTDKNNVLADYSFSADIKDNIEYDFLLREKPLDTDRLNEIVDLMLETVCTARKKIRIAGDDYPAELVKAKFMKLNSSHIEFVLDCLQENTTKIRNIKQYLRAALFNAPSTIDSYYTALVAHDMAEGKI